MNNMLVTVFCGLFILSPIDIIPDPIPFLGTLDDFVAMWVMIHKMQEMRRGSTSNVLSPAPNRQMV